ncbi:DUF7126 family protein [Halovivax gelatinilyticus]|uniref:DUF7126 family protein n=1 Tax=Halovivax gelatinilyticus TaxID=2961597 RepID=UPI0020CA8E88|nr:CTP synthetase [Halovivax gelatinilyticus]
MTNPADTTDRTDDEPRASSNEPASTAIVAGPDDGQIAGALEAEGVAVTRLDEPPTRPALETAGITDVDLYVFTEYADATSVPIARDLTTRLRIVAYASGSVPEFVRGQLDLAIDPQAMGPTIVAEELAGTA